MRDIRIGVIGCGRAAREHLERLAKLPGVEIVGCSDLKGEKARTLAGLVETPGGGAVATFEDHAEMLRAVAPDAVAIFTPHLAHYRPMIDALQAGCHAFVEKPLSTNPQEAADIVNVAKARNRVVAVGQPYRLRPSLVEARRRLEAGAIGRVRLAVATLAQPWLAAHAGPDDSWRFDPKIVGGGILADAGDHLVDALLWSLGGTAAEVAAVQDRGDSGVDLVTAAAIRMADGTPVTLGLAGVSARSLFEITYFGELGTIRAGEDRLVVEMGSAEGEGEVVPLPAPIEAIDGDFLAAVRGERAACCPADQAIATVRLLEAIARSAATGQVIRLA